MSEEVKVCAGVDSSLVVRQPIFKADQSIWAYELVGMDSGQGASVLAGVMADQETSKEGGVVACDIELVEGKEVFVSLELDDVAIITSSSIDLSGFVLGVRENLMGEIDGGGLIETVHEKGGKIALVCNGLPSIESDAVNKFDILKISLADKAPSAVVSMRKQLEDFQCELLAADIDGWEAYDGTCALKFDYLQGPFFAVPHIKAGAELSSGSIAKLELLRILNDPAVEIEEIAEVISRDVTLSYRILAYINSASFGLRSKVGSIQQAVSLLGLKELKHWATVVVMSDIDSTPKGEELAHLALLRGRFLSELTDTFEWFAHSKSTMFMLGLFSKLDALLSFPMAEALEGLPLDNDVKEGLCGVQNEFYDWVRVLESAEEGNWVAANKILARHDITLATVAKQYMAAMKWAAEQMADMKS